MSASAATRDHPELERAAQISLARASEHWLTHAQAGQFNSFDGTPIAYACLHQSCPRGLVVVATGRAQTYLQYAELAHELHREGYAVALYDHRGQGLSGRLLQDPHKGHVGTFADYATDLQRLLQILSARYPSCRRALLGHSLGGTVAAQYAIENPTDFDALVMVAPFFGLPIWRASRHLLATILWLERSGRRYFAQDPGYIPGMGSKYGANSDAFARLTHSAQRYNAAQRVLQAHPRAALGAPTSHWLYEAYRAFDILQAQAHRIKAPLLLLQAQADRVVDNNAQDHFWTRCSDRIQHKLRSSNQRIVIDGGRHELLHEIDAIRTPTVLAIQAFLRHHLRALP